MTSVNVVFSVVYSFLLPLTSASLICFFVMFILLLVMAPSEVLISQKNGVPEVEGEASDAWVAVALGDEAFRCFLLPNVHCQWTMY